MLVVVVVVEVSILELEDTMVGSGIIACDDFDGPGLAHAL